MTLRSQTIALVVLFASIAVVFVLVGDVGVSTDAIKATRTPVPTATATPLAVGDASRWQEAQPGQLQYVSDDPALQGQLVYVSQAQDELLGLLAVEPAAEGAPYPLLDLIGQRHTALIDSVNERQFVLDPAVDDDPVLRIVSEVPMAMFQARVEVPGEPGTEPTVIDVIELMAQGADDKLVFVQYSGTGSPAITADFWAWLDQNIAEIAQITGEDAEASPESTEAAPPETTESTPEATEAAPDATESTPEATEAAPDEAESTPEATEAAP